MEVADHGVVRLGDDRGFGVGVDRDDGLRALAAGHVLDRSADSAGQVQLRGDLRTGLAHLLPVRAPALTGHDSGDAKRAAEQGGEFLEHSESVGSAHTATAAHDHAGSRERDPGFAIGRFRRLDDQIGVRQPGLVDLHDRLNGLSRPDRPGWTGLWLGDRVGARADSP
jgi:hypothetical protein